DVYQAIKLEKLNVRKSREDLRTQKIKDLSMQREIKKLRQEILKNEEALLVEAKETTSKLSDERASLEARRRERAEFEQQFKVKSKQEIRQPQSLQRSDDVVIKELNRNLNVEAQKARGELDSLRLEMEK